MAGNIEEITQKLDAISEGLNAPNLSGEDVAFNFDEYLTELYRIPGYNREYPKNLEKYVQERPVQKRELDPNISAKIACAKGKSVAD